LVADGILEYFQANVSNFGECPKDCYREEYFVGSSTVSTFDAESLDRMIKQGNYVTNMKAK